jgi:hypothetical protein
LEGEGEFFISCTNLLFVGNFKKGLKNGKGIIEKANYKFEGEFLDDFRNGKFIETFFEKGI